MFNDNSDGHFRQFAASLEAAIAVYGEMPEKTFIQRQRAQVELLVALEREFRKILIAHWQGPSVYRAFIRFITEQRRNILAARPFFRERQDIFTKQISKALRSRAVRSLYKFHFNFNFITFVLAAKKWRPNSKITKLANQIADIRNELVTMNMPLAISRARIFWSHTPKSHLSYMDLVQICSEGLMSAVDKFCLPYSKAFRHVAIGRMLGNLIENYSETSVHFYPIDKRKIYRANKLLRKMFPDGNVDFAKLAAQVNIDPKTGEQVPLAHRTNAIEIASLLSAASTVSSDSMMPKDSEAPEIGEMFADDESNRPDVIVERNEMADVMNAAMAKLPLRDRKVFRMKGIEAAL